MKKATIFYSSNKRMIKEGVTSFLLSSDIFTTIESTSVIEFWSKESMIILNSKETDLIIVFYEQTPCQSLFNLTIRIRQNSQRPMLIIAERDFLLDDLKVIVDSSTGSLGIVGQDLSQESMLAHILFLMQGKNRLLMDFKTNYDINVQPSIKNLTQLTPRETQVLAYAQKGYSIAQTAEACNLSINTISAFRTKIRKKTGTKSIAQAVALLLG